MMVGNLLKYWESISLEKQATNIKFVLFVDKVMDGQLWLCNEQRIWSQL